MAKRTTRKPTRGRAASAATESRDLEPEYTKPQRRSCATLQNHFRLLDSFPQFRFNQARLEQLSQFATRSGRVTTRTTPLKVPVAVHVVFRTAAENISDGQIKSQIKLLNKDFRAKNTDISKVPAPFKALVGDPMIEFTLASRDPAGGTTSGITRTQTAETSFAQDDRVKSSHTGGADPWDTQRYLNIWVCRLRGTLLGYAQFPGGPPATDGVVIRNTAFGTGGITESPFNKGRTTTHEVGHYFNLSHIWGENRIPTCGDSDFVSDTPNQFAPNEEKPAFPHISCNNAPNGDLYMNYMDYVDDDAMFMFTKGQVARMNAAIENERSGLGT